MAKSAPILPTLLVSWVSISEMHWIVFVTSEIWFFIDVISIEKSGEHFRLLYDVKGRFTIHRITPEEASYKLLKVRQVAVGSRGVPHIVTHDGRTIRYPDPLIRVNDTVKFDLEQNKIVDFVPFDTGNIVMITGGRNMGRAGVITHRERHIGGFDIVHVKDSLDRSFATQYVIFVWYPCIICWLGIEYLTYSWLVRALSPGSHCPRAKVSSLLSPKNVISGGSVHSRSSFLNLCLVFPWHENRHENECALCILPVVLMTWSHYRVNTASLFLFFPLIYPFRHLSSRIFTTYIHCCNHFCPVKRHGKTCELVEGRVLWVRDAIDLNCGRWFGRLVKVSVGEVFLDLSGEYSSHAWC